MRGIFPVCSYFFDLRPLRGAVASLLLAAVLAGLGTGAASAATCVSWTGLPAATPGASASGLVATTVLSPCDAWAVGQSVPGEPAQTLIEHWDGASWTVVPSPSPGTSNNVLNGVHAISATNVWAVGSYSNGAGDRSLILHWDGVSWAKVPSPNFGSSTSLSAVGAASASDAWAVGGYAIIAAAGGTRAALGARAAVVGSNTLVLHWNGSKWKQVASPNPGSGGGLTGVTATSAGNAWAVGGFTSGGADQTLVLRWNGTAWKRQPSPDPGGGNGSGLDAVAATSASDAWAVGRFGNGTVNQNLVLHWNGAKWAQVPAPDVGGANNFNVLHGVAAASAGSARAVGDYATPGGENTLVLRWNGTNWAIVPSPTPGTADAVLLGVAAGSATDFWAVGFFEGTASGEALALHCC